MEYVDTNDPESYVPFERRAFLNYIDKTIGQPIFAVITQKGEPDILAVAGINSGAIDQDVLIEDVEGNIFGHNMDEHMFVAGYEELSDYLGFQLTGWQVDAMSPETIGEVVSLISAAKRLELQLEAFDFDTELSHAWDMIAQLKTKDHQAIVHMLYAVHESDLSSRLEQHMREVVQSARSLRELYDQPLLRGYMEVLFGNNHTPVEEITLLQAFISPVPLEK